jgi:hypothetical protein
MVISDGPGTVWKVMEMAEIGVGVFTARRPNKGSLKSGQREDAGFQ